MQVVIDQPIGTLTYPGVAKGLYVASPSGFSLHNHMLVANTFASYTKIMIYYFFIHSHVQIFFKQAGIWLSFLNIFIYCHNICEIVEVKCSGKMNQFDEFYFDAGNLH